ncbi:UBIQUITIN CONJUGATING ENZYME E2 [Encephalitozoon cuniculi GB-M1]|uniref:Probable ubiquitin-conjugating enzyme E2 ECU01_1010 n=1 Tax=Encephalitozoon cuniculi (strain GB-M1) TaxID=284813 RepID=Y1A1_ENCCU|nr:ubiquitin conjugating enzyme E2 [Encephalitozoon cuniculi GB-M1]Q8SSK3.1 RecName: Full=Probable ubiquitin-conjugating enzyme E2 ECU01_1010; AltName: Full=E2 ubiquitin-conjugating enzyme ECU01_1010 [Encephalitozoon cuniculi GB-M1]CAD24972.1 UBIQUITIN CONJUGATING ENZYME E2 [Encephalitozoon cuniculi GB-M1]
MFKPSAHRRLPREDDIIQEDDEDGPLWPSALRRLSNEEERLKIADGDERKLFSAYPRGSMENRDYKVWDIYFTLGGDSLYAGRILKAVMKFPSSYPLRPPTLKFVSKMFHPNIYEDGKMCISILEEDKQQDSSVFGDPKDKWTPVQNIRTIVMSIVVILNSPNISSPANVDASVMYRDNPEEYIKEVIRIAREEDEKLRRTDPQAREVALQMKAEN